MTACRAWGYRQFDLKDFLPCLLNLAAEEASLGKTKVSRAVTKLEQRRFARRKEVEADGRHTMLGVTTQGRAAFVDLCDFARKYDGQLVAELTAQKETTLRKCLSKLASIADWGRP